MRQRTPSYSPPPRRSYGGRGRRPSPRGRYGGRYRDLPTSLLVRNVHRDCTAEDLRRPFRQFGPIKDVYLPKDYYTGEPRGFGFVQYVDPDDAAEAKYYMDRQILLGREITVVFAEENRKKPAEMRSKERIRGRMDYGCHCSPYYSQSRSLSPGYSPSPRREHYSRSYSSRDRRYRDYSYSPRERRYHEYSYSPCDRRYRDYSYSPHDRRYREYSYSPHDRRYREYSYSPRDRRYREYSYSRSRSCSSRYDSPVGSYSRSNGRSSSRSPSCTSVRDSYGKPNTGSLSHSRSYSESSDRD